MFAHSTIHWRNWLAIGALAYFLVHLGFLQGCHSLSEGGDNIPGPDPQVETAPAGGTATLKARTTYDDFQGATLSIEHGVVIDDGRVRNDWDLLFGNDWDAQRDVFTVNMVTDDRSFIVDLGRVSLGDLPLTVSPADHPPGIRGEHDEVVVQLGHVYVVRTLDTDTTQYAVFRVVAHDLNHSVTIRWYRSLHPNRLVIPAADVEI